MGIAFANVFSWPGILIPLLGTILAMIASFLPGIGNASIAVLALVLSANWDPLSVMLLFGALTGGATFMGSITAILFNIPGNVSSTPALLDGHPLARMGWPKTAIACAATASAVGSVFGVIVLLVLLPIIQPYILAFGPLEVLLIGVLGLMTVIALPTTSTMKSALMVALGLLAAMIGSDPDSGQPRWSLGSVELSMGVGIIPVMLGIYTIGEMLHWTSRGHLSSTPTSNDREHDTAARGVRFVFSNIGLTFRSSWIGTFVGMVPGIGGTVAGFIAYGHAVQSSGKDNQQFGKGDVRGLIAPEAAVDAKDGGSLLPTLALGLPGSEACVILLAAFTLHGLVPGTPMLTTHLALSYTLILALLLSNILTSVVGVALAPALSKLSSFRIDRLILPCLLICMLSAVLSDGRIIDLYIMVFFGVAGYFWRRHDWPTTPFVIAFVLGKLIEQNLNLSLQLIALNRIVPTERSLTVFLVLLIIAALGWKILRRKKRDQSEQAFEQSLGLALISTVICTAMAAWLFLSGTQYSWYATLIVLAATILSVTFAIQCYNQDRTTNGLGESHSLLGGLRPAAGHGRLLMIIAAAAPLSWFLGFTVALGLTAGAWLFVHSRLTKRDALKSCLCGVGVGLIAAWVMNVTASTLLDKGWLWSQLTWKFLT